MDLEGLTARSREVWGTGDYAPTSRQLQPVSAALVDSLGVGPRHRVLDVAAGDGNCAMAAARRGADVTASDFSPVMIARGRGRTEAAGLDVAWREADAAELPFEDGSFDRVLSTFGAIFAPAQERTAGELVRVTAPGGAVGITAWTVDGLIARMIRDLAPPAPPSSDAPPDPMAWGDPATAERLLGGAGRELTITPRVLTFSYPSWDDWRRDFEAHGMSVAMKASMSADEYESAVATTRAFLAAHARRDGDGVAYDAEYLEIRVDVLA